MPRLHTLEVQDPIEGKGQPGDLLAKAARIEIWTLLEGDPSFSAQTARQIRALCVASMQCREALAKEEADLAKEEAEALAKEEADA